MEEGLVHWLAALHPVIPEVLVWTSLVLVLAIGIIAATPWKGDDKLLEDIKKFPFVGGVLAALIKWSPIKPKE